MRSIRKFAYAAVLSLSIFAAQPTPAAAEDVHGAFTLSHEVHWQKVVLRPGDYTFSVRSLGASQLLTLRELDGSTDAVLMVRGVDTPKPDEVSRLVLVSRNGQSFVSAMALPDYEMTLRFAVPRDGTIPTK
jgi:hypothetical protein